MIPLFYYLLKVTVCSGVLFLYYYAALRNKDFHQWNRFYLLISVVLSLLLPLGFIRFTPENTADHNAITLIYSANGYLQEFNLGSAAKRADIPWMEAGYSVVCLFFLVSLIKALLRIRKIAVTHEGQHIGNIKFFDTEEAGTPFSFLHYLFWNKKIDLHSKTGQQIFGHELVHIKEKHTLDKLFMQLVLAGAWANPFFWLIKKELSVLHEFIADKKAAGEHGASTLAAMILQSTFPDHFHQITNPFFHSSIKRRFTMLTKTQNKRLSYAGRIAVLPLAAFIIFAFAVKPGEKAFIKMQHTVPAAQPVLSGYSKNASSIRNGGNVYQNGKDTVPAKAEKKKIIIHEAGKPSEKSIEVTSEKVIITGKGGKKDVYVRYNDAPAGHNITGVWINGSSATPLIFVDGIEVQEPEMKKLSPDRIEAVDVIKGEAATSKYGDKAKAGVILITTKKGINITLAPKIEAVFSEVETGARISADKWTKFLNDNLLPFVSALQKKAPAAEYRVDVKFLVREDGTVSDFRVLNDPGYGIGNKVLEIMKNSPKWEPALQNGREVASYHTQPISFTVAP